MSYPINDMKYVVIVKQYKIEFHEFIDSEIFFTHDLEEAIRIVDYLADNNARIPQFHEEIKILDRETKKGIYFKMVPGKESL